MQLWAKRSHSRFMDRNCRADASMHGVSQQIPAKLAYIAPQTMHAQIIYIQPGAPQKPAIGAACNGCGICCLSEPCPLGVALFRRKRGACQALQWSDTIGKYRCGVLVDTDAVLRQAFPRLAAGLLRWISPWVSRLAYRWIAAGIGCDSSLQPESSPTMDGFDTSKSNTPPA